MATKRGRQAKHPTTARQSVDQRLLRALSHPLRQRILGALHDRVASPAELSRELAEPIGNVSYHVKMLRELGAIELVRTAPVRGALEHFYRASATAGFADPETSVSFTNLDLDERGYKEVAATMAEALKRLKDIEAAASKRLAELPESDRHANRTEVVMLQVERPLIGPAGSEKVAGTKKGAGASKKAAGAAGGSAKKGPSTRPRKS
jgi:DNA-binding transcriptional ArsR family regulator